MKPTFEQMKGAAIDVRRKFFADVPAHSTILSSATASENYVFSPFVIARIFLANTFPITSEVTMRMFWKHLACGSSYTTTAACGCI